MDHKENNVMTNESRKHELTDSQLESVTGGSGEKEEFSGSGLEAMRKRMADARRNRRHADSENDEYFF